MADLPLVHHWFLTMIAATLCGALLIILAPLAFIPRLVRLLGSCRCMRTLVYSRSAEGEECEFVNSDGLTLRGTYVPADSSARRGVVLFAHEAGGDRWSVSLYLDAVRQAGFDIFTFDFRCHGTSDSPPRHELRPWVTPAEVQDVRAAVDYVCSRPDADPRGVAILGRSRGGVAALCAAAPDPRIICVVADSCFSHETLLPHFIRRYAHKYIPCARLLDAVPDTVLWWYARLALVRVVGRTHAKYLSLRRCFQQLRQPVLLIHGEHDTWVPTHVAQSIADKVRWCTLWLVRGARHNNSVQVAPGEYALRVTQFMVTHLQCRSTITNAKPARRHTVRCVNA